MEIDYIKLQRQIQGVDLFFENNCTGTLEYVFQFGKTYTTKLIIDRLVKDEEISNIHIVVPNKALVDQWYYRLTSEKSIQDIIKKVNIEIQSVHEVLNSGIKRESDLLVLDDVHLFLSKERYKIIEGHLIEYKRILGLTATYPEGDDKRKLDKYCPVIDTITYEEAIRNNWISELQEYNLKVELSEVDKIRYARFSEPIAEMIERFRGLHKEFKYKDGSYLFNSDFTLIIACYTGYSVQQNQYKKIYVKGNIFRNQVAKLKGWRADLDLTNELNRRTDDKWNPNNLATDCKRFKEFVEKRNSILINNQNKLKVIIDIFKKFPEPTLCFNESIDFANKIAYNINRYAPIIELNATTAVAFHSSIKSKICIDPETGDYYRYVSGDKKGLPKPIGPETLKKYILDDIKEGRTMFISTVKTLKEGITIENLKTIISSAGDSNPVTYSQKVGRGMSINPEDLDKNTRIINLYFDDFEIEDKKVRSRDKQKLIQRQIKSENQIKWVDNINEIV